MEDVGIFYVHVVYFTAKWYKLWPFGTFCALFGIFFPVLIGCTEKNLATLILCARFIWMHNENLNYNRHPHQKHT
jgi:hypothetical protein